MKLDLKTFLIAGLTIVVIVLVMRNCSRPSEEREAESKKMYETEIAILKVEKTSIQAAQDSIVKQVTVRARKDSVQLAAQDSKIKALQAKLTNQRPKVIEKIQADSAVLSYVSTLEDVVTEMKVQNDTLKASLEFHAKVNQDLISMERIEDKIEADMAMQYEFRIAELEKASRKREKRSKLKGILVPVALIGGLLFGANL